MITINKNGSVWSLGKYEVDEVSYIDILVDGSAIDVIDPYNGKGEWRFNCHEEIELELLEYVQSVEL